MTHARIVALWNQDTPTIGRILRAHLFVEHFLTECLQARNPQLALEEARLTFAQKVALMGKAAPAVAYLRPGMSHLNKVRNRVAHTLKGDVTPEDARVFLDIELFRALRDERAKRDADCGTKSPSNDPIDVLEDFAKHTGIALSGSASGEADLWAEAIRLAQQDIAKADKTG